MTQGVLAVVLWQYFMIMAFHTLVHFNYLWYKRQPIRWRLFNQQIWVHSVPNELHSTRKLIRVIHFFDVTIYNDRIVLVFIPFFPFVFVIITLILICLFKCHFWATAKKNEGEITVYCFALKNHVKETSQLTIKRASDLVGFIFWL